MLLKLRTILTPSYKLVFSALVAILLLSISYKPTLAATCSAISGTDVTLPKDATSHTIVFDTSTLNKSDSYYVKVKGSSVAPGDEVQTGNFDLSTDTTHSFSDTTVTVQNGGNQVTLTLTGNQALGNNLVRGIFRPSDDHFVALYRHQGGSNRVCEIGWYTTQVSSISSENCQLFVKQVRNGDWCYAPGCIDKNVPVKIELRGLIDEHGQPLSSGNSNQIWFIIGANGADVVRNRASTVSNGAASMTFTPQTPSLHTVRVEVKRLGVNFPVPNCNKTATFGIADRNCTADQCAEETPIMTSRGDNIEVVPYRICDQIDPSLTEMRADCLKCIENDPEGRSGVWTAIGCIKKDPVGIVQNLIKLGLGMGGGVALIMILVSGFMFSISQGDAKRTGEARDMLIAAITGLIFIIFSVTILQFIGYSVFRIPGFGG